MENTGEKGQEKTKPLRVDIILQNEKEYWSYKRPRWLSFLAILLVVSLFFRYVLFRENRISFARWMLLHFPWFRGVLYTFLTSAFSLQAFQEILKCIGISSLLIGWLYGVLQKEDSGLYYSELLEQLYPRYNRLVLTHVLAFLVGFWQVYTGSREGAMISVLIIVLYSFPLWNALSCLVFFPVYRRRLVQLCWEDELKKAFLEEDQSNTGMESIYRLTDAISLKSPGGRTLVGCFAMALEYLIRQYIEKAGKTDGETSATTATAEASAEAPTTGSAQQSGEKTAEDPAPNAVRDYKSMLIRLTSCWDHLLRNRSQGDRNILLRETFLRFRLGLDNECVQGKPEDASKRSLALLALGQSYMLWLSEDLLEAYSMDDRSRMSGLLPKINNDLSVTIHSYLFDEERELVEYITTGYLLIMWFFCIFHGVAILEADQLDSMPLLRKIGDEEKPFWQVFMEILLPWAEDREEKTEFALQQINARVAMRQTAL